MNLPLTFPVLVLYTEPNFEVFLNEEALCSCGPIALKGGYYDGMRLFDSDGLTWIVEGCTLIRELTLWEQIVYGILFWREFPMKLTLSNPVRDGQPLVVEELCRIIDNDPDDLYDQFVSHDELKQLLRNAKSPAEVIRITHTLGYEEMDLEASEST